MTNEEMPANVRVDIGGWLQGAWEFFIEDWIAWVIMGGIYCLAFTVLSQVAVLGHIAFFVLRGPLLAGLFYAAFCRMRGTPATVGMMFVPIQTAFGPLVLVGVVGGILQYLGILGCFIGVFVTIALWLFGIPLVLERGLPFWDALETSRTTVQEQLGQWVLFTLVCGVIVVAGVLVLGVGVFATLPIGILMVALAYRDVFGLQPVSAPPVTPRPAPPTDQPAA